MLISCAGLTIYDRMVNQERQTTKASPPSWKQPFRATFSAAMVAWLLGLLATSLLFFGDRNLLFVSCLLAVCSGAIAFCSVLGGLLTAKSVESRRGEVATTADWTGLAAAVALGMSIRVLGTVALFLTCRYHMATSTEMIAGLTIGWYVYLTSVEVFVLARELPKTARSQRAEAPHFPETSPG